MNQTVRRTLLALLVVAAVLVPAFGPARAAQDTSDPTLSGRSFSNNGGQYLRLVAFTNGGSREDQVYTQEEAIELAQRLDSIVALEHGGLTDHIEVMRRANPDITLLVYMNGAFSPPSLNADMPDEWFLKDAQGRRIKNLNFELWYMDMGNAGWRQWVADRCKKLVERGGFDGCYMDDMGVGNLSVNISGYPIDPRTNRPLDPEDWVTYGVGETAVVKATNATIHVTTNGLNNGGKYFGADSRSYRYLTAADGAQAEGWLRGAYAPATRFRSEADWKLDIDMVVDAGRRGKSTLLGTKLWDGATPAQVEQWRGYSYASLLLATDGHQYLFFSATGPGKADPESPLDSFNIGRPIGSYAKRQGVYQRDFLGGRALVNPTESSVNVALGATYLDHSGAEVTSVRMGPNTGLILRTPGFDPGDDRPTPDPVPSPTTCFGVTATILGTDAGETINGTEGDDVIVALGGDDVIYGLGGNDIICAGNGDDRVSGGSGRDLIFGEAGNDGINGSSSRDRIFGGPGNDKLTGGANSDRVNGGPGTDRCTPDSNDRITKCER